jgi:hypothetical protein
MECGFEFAAWPDQFLIRRVKLDSVERFQTCPEGGCYEFEMANP